MASYFSLDDGRAWDVLGACFVDRVPDFCSWSWPLTDAEETHDEEGLRRCLRHFGLPLGVLAEDEDFARAVRAERNRRLAETDYLAMPDYPLAPERKEAVLLYRQALRDVTAQEGFPRSPVWPEKP